MAWNVSAEAISFIIVFIISVYSRRSHAVPSLKNRLFGLCMATTLGAIGTNLASTLLIAYAPVELLPLTWFVTWVYFILTPLLGTAYFYYDVAVVSEARAVSRRFIALSALPCLVYFVCVLVNIPTGWLFWFDQAGGYHQGPIIVTTYLVFYFYCVACFAMVVFTRAPIDPAIKRILAVFPLVAIGVIGVQQMFPAYLLSGSAAACSLLIIYLYLQNKRLSVDMLTSIPNRQEFLSMVALMHEKRRPFTAVIVSLSNFKFINDKFGHENGDHFLREFTRFLEKIDTGAHLYRYSGDQFTLIIDDEEARKSYADRNLVADFLDALRARLAEPWQVDGHSYKMSAAIGVVSYYDIAHTPGDVIAALEYAVTQSKRLDPNTPCFCEPHMMDAIHRRNTIAGIVREAVKTGGFSVHYQPIWSDEHKQFVAAEALCRLTDDELGVIPPDEFIPIAEQIGVIADITQLVLNEACTFVREYRDEHPDTRLSGVSVNFSPVQFMQDDLAQSVIDTLERHGIPASCLRIEITESAILANPDAVETFMEALHEHGVLFYLDDFGTGYSNMSTMLNLPFDMVKLDKSLLRSATDGGNGTAFLGHLIACFKSTGSLVLCEGVETQDQREYLNRCGCTIMQGYLFSRPLPPAEAAKTISESEAQQLQG